MLLGVFLLLGVLLGVFLLLGVLCVARVCSYC